MWELTMIQKSRSGQTAVEYIMLLAVVVGMSFVIKNPLDRFLTGFFGRFSGRAVTASVKPTFQNYQSNDTKGCSAQSAPGSSGGCE
jgi:hypothetical protein